MFDFKTLIITILAAIVTYSIALVADYYFGIWAGV